MSQVPTENNGSAKAAKPRPPLTWNGTLIDVSKVMTYYLHLSAFPCEKCHGPVIAGSLGTRSDDISQETDLRKIGAACITCGFRPEMMIEPSVGHHFRPVEWKWDIQAPAAPVWSGSLPDQARSASVSSTNDQLTAELSQDADIQ
jgi:hypothetical protein